MNAKISLSLTCATSALLATAPASAAVAAKPVSSPSSTPAITALAITAQPTPTDKSGNPATAVIEPDEPVLAPGKVRVEERDTIVVNGNRFQKLLSQPQGKSLITAEERNLAGIGNVRTLVDSQPGFNYTDSYGLNVRGVGRQTQQTLLGQENSVLQYVDGFINLVPFNIAESTLFGGNVQFTRGPAGTLYGRNALAGAVNLISRAPTSTWSGEVEGGLGRAGYRDIGVNVAGPLTSNLGIRLGAQQFKIPSIQHNLGPDQHAGYAQKNLYLEFQVEWRYRGFHIRNRLTHFEYDNQPGYPSRTSYATGGVFGGLGPNPQFNYAGPAPSNPYQINVNFTGFDRLRKNFQDIVNADLDVGFAKLIYVGGYQKYLATGSADLDQTSRTSYDPFALGPNGKPIAPIFAPGTIIPTDYRSNYDNNNHFGSHELRLESKAGSRLGWVLGAYYFKQHFNEHYYETVANANTVNTAIPGTTGVINNPIVGTPGGTSGPNPLSANFEQRNIENIRSKALFGNVTYDLSPTLRFDGGLRYTWDHKDATTNFRYVFFYPPFFAGDFSPLIHSASPRKNDQGVSGRAALAYRPNGKDQLYVAYSRGYLASAFTLGQGLPPNNIAKSEHLDVFEVGGNKSVGPLRFDGSIFYENLANQQIPVFAQLRTPGPNNTTILGTYTTLINAKRSEIYGAELQATWRPTTHSSLVASYTYLHPTFKSFCPALSTQSTCGVVDILGTNSPQSLSGNEIPRTPRNKASLYGYYGFNLGNAGFLYPGGSIAYQSGFYTQPFQIDRYHVPGRTIVGLTLTYRTPGEHLDVTGTVLNLFRKYYSDNGGVQIIGTTVDRSTTYGQDQYWTVTARYRF